jgi:protein-tyrosine phosphatase
VVDLHCHVLPGVDDGPRVIESSLALCRAARDDGTRTLVATPHVNPDYPDVTAALIQELVGVVNGALRAEDIDVTVRPGAEVALSRVGELSDLELDQLGLGGHRYLLIELPWTAGAPGSVAALRALAGRGYGIVLAHPERSPIVQSDRALVSGLLDEGMLCCLDAGSLGDAADRRTRATAWELLAGGLAHAIASDCHDAVRRPPRLKSMLEAARLTPDEIDYFAGEAPEAILNGDAVGSPPALGDRRRRHWLRPRW